MSNPILHPSAQNDPVKPVRPAAPYIGGKRVLSKRLVQRINAVPHSCYAEPFVGMGGIFFRRDQKPKAEFINDWSQDVANFFRILRHHYEPFIDQIAWLISSRDEFEQMRRCDPDTLTDLQRAARFFYLQRTSFGGKVKSRSFGISHSGSARFNPLTVRTQLAAIRDRLATVTIERLPWADFIRRYDRAGTLFYLDPPYFGCENDYGLDMFSRDEFVQMADQLRGIKGRFILSINDKPQVRDIFAGFDFEQVDCTYTIGSNVKAAVFPELIISN